MKRVNVVCLPLVISGDYPPCGTAMRAVSASPGPAGVFLCFTSTTRVADATGERYTWNPRQARHGGSHIGTPVQYRAPHVPGYALRARAAATVSFQGPCAAGPYLLVQAREDSGVSRSAASCYEWCNSDTLLSPMSGVGITLCRRHLGPDLGSHVHPPCQKPISSFDHIQ